MPSIVLTLATSPEDVRRVAALFEEYASSLEFSLCFQGFDQELAGLPGAYAPPDGRLLLARVDGTPAGCVGLRRIGEGICEMKRLFVRPHLNGTGLGRRLATAVIDEARRSGYATMKLDTLPSMKAAIRLYESLGFRDTVPYTRNPLEGARYMELALAPEGALRPGMIGPMLTAEPPKFPAGAQPVSVSGAPGAGLAGVRLTSVLDRLERAPELLRRAVAGLDEAALDTRYRNWTIRQIVHHLADSHLHAYLRFKWGLAEDEPAIKPYDESKWSALPVALAAPVGPSLDLFGSVHAAWLVLLRAASPADFRRIVHHPELPKPLQLAELPPLYAWHAEHHTAQITWRLAHMPVG